MEDDRSKPYHCPVPPDQSSGTVYRRLRSYQVMMATISCEELSFIVRNNAACDFAVGGRFQLRFGSDQFEIEVSDRENLDDERTLILAKLVRDLTKIEEGSVSPWSAIFNTRRLDPMWCISLAAAAIFLALMLPGWGDRLGTSDAITHTAQSLLESFRSAFR